MLDVASTKATNCHAKHCQPNKSLIARTTDKKSPSIPMRFYAMEVFLGSILAMAQCHQMQCPVEEPPVESHCLLEELGIVEV
jgi:hypothetical protein